MKKLLITLAIILVPTLVFATPVSWDGNTSTQILQPLKSFWGANIKASYFTATSTTATSTFPIASSTCFWNGNTCLTATSPGGASSTIQFNANGAFGGDGNFIYTGTSTILNGLASSTNVSVGWGTNSAPGIYFSGQSNTGIYNDSTVAGFSPTITANGTRVMRFNAASNTIYVPTQANTTKSFYLNSANGAVGTPTYAFNNDANTGVWSSGADYLELVTGGVNALSINSSQEVAATGKVTAPYFVATTSDYSQFPYINMGGASSNRIDYDQSYLRGYRFDNTNMWSIGNGGDGTFLSLTGYDPDTTLSNWIIDQYGAATFSGQVNSGSTLNAGGSSYGHNGELFLYESGSNLYGSIVVDNNAYMNYQAQGGEHIFTGNISADNLSGTNTGDQDLSGYVPYTGATTGVNLGSQTLTTSGLITAGTYKGAALYPASNSTTAVQIRKADGTTSVLNVDTTNSRVGIGKTNPSYLLDVAGTMAATAFIGGDTGGYDGSQFWLSASSGDMNARVNSATGGTAFAFTATQSGSGNGDVRLLFANDAAWTGVMGLQDTDLDKFKICTGTPSFCDNGPFAITTGSLVGIGVDDPVAKLHIITTSGNQFRSGYSTSQYWGATTTSAGLTQFDAVGTTPLFSFLDKVGIGTTTPPSDLTVIGTTTLYTSYTPPASASTCIKGTITWDADYFYVCTATNVWERSALATW